MSDPPIILSDEDDEDDPLLIPLRFISRSKKPRTGPQPDPTVVLIDDDPTPKKPGATFSPAFVPDTPMSAPAMAKPSASDSERKFSGGSSFSPRFKRFMCSRKCLCDCVSYSTRCLSNPMCPIFFVLFCN